MKLVISDKTKHQNDLLGNFLAALDNAKTSIATLAISYEACIKSGMDMSRYVSKSLGMRLLSLAEGRLLPAAYDRLLGNDAMTRTMIALPLDTQKSLLADGVPIWRDGKAQTLPAEEIRANEARKLLDVTGGKARLLTPDEQAARLEPVMPRQDKLVELRLRPEEYEALAISAHKAKQSIVGYIKTQLHMHGVIGKLRKAG